MPKEKKINPEEYFKKKLNHKYNLELFPAIGPIKPLKTWKDFENLQEPNIEIKLETRSQHSYHKKTHYQKIIQIVKLLKTHKIECNHIGKE